MFGTCICTINILAILNTKIAEFRIHFEKIRDKYIIFRVL